MLTYRADAVAAKLTTPPEGVVTVETGDCGNTGAGPSAVDGLVVVHTGLTSAAVGAGGLPGIWGPVDAPDPGQTATSTDATTTSVAAATASKAFPDGNLPDARW